MFTESTAEILGATAITALLFESVKVYRSACPDLDDLRVAPANDPATLQRLVDADITIGIPVILAGCIASWIMRSWVPLAVVMLAFGTVAGYHHSILSDPH